MNFFNRMGGLFASPQIPQGGVMGEPQMQPQQDGKLAMAAALLSGSSAVPGGRDFGQIMGHALMAGQLASRQTQERIQEQQQQQQVQEYRQAQLANEANKIDRVDMGDSIGLIQNGQLVGRLPKGISPDTQYRGGIDMRGQDIGAGTAREGHRVSMRGQDIGANTAIRGQDLNYNVAMTEDEWRRSKADAEAAAAQEKAAARAQSRAAQAVSVLSEVTDAKNLVGRTTAGLGGATMGKVAGSGARDLEAKLGSIKANLGFDRLQQMREESPTGGALGQVAVQELVALQSTVASLDRSQSPAQLAAALEKVEQHYANYMRELGYDIGTPSAASAPASNVGVIQRAQGYY